MDIHRHTERCDDSSYVILFMVIGIFLYYMLELYLKHRK